MPVRFLSEENLSLKQLIRAKLTAVIFIYLSTLISGSHFNLLQSFNCSVPIRILHQHLKVTMMIYKFIRDRRQSHKYIIHL